VGAAGGGHQQQRARGRLVRLRRVAYLAAWLYLCGWVIALSLGRVPASATLASVGVAAAAVLLIIVVLVSPRPAPPAATSEMHGVSHTK